MLPNEKVSELKDYGVYEDIIAFFEEFDQKVNNKRNNKDNVMEKSSTRISYEKNIREFFKIVLDKDVEHLTEDDLKLKKRDIINYRTQLINKGNANGTVNQKMSSVKSLFTSLNAEHDVNIAIFNIKRLDDNPNSYGNLSQTEAERFAETAHSTEREKPFLKKMLILFAIRTSFRIDEILNVKWNDFEYVDGVYKITVVGKRSKINTNSISAKLYNEIAKLKELNKDDSELVFQISENAVNEMMKRLREKLEIKEERNIVFHSFRKVAIDWELEMTGDIKKAAQQGNHTNIDTTYRHYINKNRDYTQTPGVRMEEDIDLSFLDQLSIEDFKEFIKQGNFKLQLDIQNFANNNLK